MVDFFLQSQGDVGVLNSHVVCARTSQGDVGIPFRECPPAPFGRLLLNFAAGNTHITPAGSMMGLFNAG
jgi:hypothetical protein